MTIKKHGEPRENTKGEKRESYEACLQKNQSGSVLFTVIVMVGTKGEPADTGM